MEKCSLNGSGNVKLTSAQLSGRHGKQQDTAIHRAFHFANKNGQRFKTAGQARI
ncbi:MAG: hypothetical protein ACO1RA_11820 [Planctomycetaceae bacterium]